MLRTLRFTPAGATFTAALFLALGLGLAAASAAAGPIGFQATGGWYTDNSDLFLGAGARVGAGTITVIPNAEWLFEDHASAYSLNIDGTMSVLPLGVASGYVGAGIGWLTVDPDGGKSSTDTVVNLLAGAGLNALPLKPFAQIKYVIAEGDDPFQFALGVRF
jgi:hypothetical protein